MKIVNDKFKITPQPVLSSQFEKIARDLFINYELKLNEVHFQLSEIEFYYQTTEGGPHHDKFVHANDKQKENGTWYFHGSGIDITMGDGKNYGGILIRGIRRDSDGEFISGPLNVAKEIFGQFGSVNCETIEFGIQKRKDVRTDIEKDFVAVPRVGLSQQKDPDYYNKPYRFITFISPKHSFKEKTKVAQYLKEQFGERWNDEVMVEKFGYRIIS